MVDSLLLIDGESGGACVKDGGGGGGCELQDDDDDGRGVRVGVACVESSVRTGGEVGVTEEEEEELKPNRERKSKEEAITSVCYRYPNFCKWCGSCVAKKKYGNVSLLPLLASGTTRQA